MKSCFDCIPCFFRQALEAGKLAHAGPLTLKKILDRIARTVPAFSLDSSPPEMGRIIHNTVKKMTKRRDPYRQIKARSNKLALGLYPRLKKRIAGSKNRLLTAAGLAIAGNIIDFGVKNSLNVDLELKKILQGRGEIPSSGRLFRFPAFEKALKGPGPVLYLADNAGETVFDRLFIEEIRFQYPEKNIFYAVKGEPVINDATEEDARASGIHKTAAIISTGLDAPGTVLDLCSASFMRFYRKAGLIISKGQGNFEALSKEKKNIFFLFMAKCPVVASELGCRTGQAVLLMTER